MKKIQVLIVDDNKMVRDSLKALLELEDDFSVLGDAEDGLQATEYAKAFKPDLVIMDLSMSRMDGITAAKTIKEYQPETLVVFLSVYHPDDYRNELDEARITNWISKSSTPEEIICALRTFAVIGNKNEGL